MSHSLSQLEVIITQFVTVRGKISHSLSQLEVLPQF